MECTGEAHFWYYLYLILAHSYFLFEYLLKFAVQDYKYKYIFTFESMLEIITIIPFFFTLLVYGKDSDYFQFFVMLDQFRLFLYSRYTSWIIN